MIRRSLYRTRADRLMIHGLSPPVSAICCAVSDGARSYDRLAQLWRRVDGVSIFPHH
ncbi:hypothetical protein KCP77_03055 [Salmonella enterica subsp. enterica]|nr:hypothetical protein KCP77_03055 [Salmonella enterica subsp. enterica]